MKKSQRILASGVVIGLSLVVALSVTLARSSRPHPSPPVEGARTERGHETIHVLAGFPSDEVEALSAPDYLMHILADPAHSRGFIRGTITDDGSVVELPGVNPQFPDRYTDYRFRVAEYVGREPAPFGPGDLISIRTRGAKGDTVDYRPSLHQGGQYLIRIGNHGTFGGGDTPTRIAAILDFQDVFEIAGEGVRGQGRFRDFKEPAGQFIARVRTVVAR